MDLECQNVNVACCPASKPYPTKPCVETKYKDLLLTEFIGSKSNFIMSLNLLSSTTTKT
jgi:hypothetical protein